MEQFRLSRLGSFISTNESLPGEPAKSPAGHRQHLWLKDFYSRFRDLDLHSTPLNPHVTESMFLHGAMLLQVRGVARQEVDDATPEDLLMPPSFLSRRMQACVS